MEHKSYASSIPACNMVISLLIFSQLPILFGKADPNAAIYTLPWQMAAYPVIFLCVALMYKNGEFVDATMNAILSSVLMGQNFVRGIITLSMYNSGRVADAGLVLSSYAIDKWVYMVSGCILLIASWLSHFSSKMATAGLLAGSIAFLSLAANYAGFGSVFSLAGAFGFVILGLYLLYSGLALLVNTALHKELLPIK